MRDNYEDFERLMGAKLNEIRAQMAVSGSGPAVSGSGDSKMQEWISFHEPKINYM